MTQRKSFPQWDTDFQYEKCEDAVRKFCRQNDLPFLDLTEFMAKHPRRYEYKHF
jgi:hypothetical protein